ncbi:hypothetical protein RUND412_009579 [Rhizina undulata]
MVGSSKTTLVEDKMHSQTFSIENLSAKSVTIYPSQAAIVRDIESVIIKPGCNEIIINNLSEFTDENSIKVEGHGTDAQITDITAEQYMTEDAPEEDDNPTDFDSDYDSEKEMSKSYDIMNAETEISVVKEKIMDQEQIQATAEKQLAFLDNYSSQVHNFPRGPLTDKPIVSIEEVILVYGQQRQKLFQTYSDAAKQLTRLRKLHAEKQSALRKLKLRFLAEHKEERKARDQKIQERQKKNRYAFERHGRRLAYRVKITVESYSLPASTRNVPASISTGRPPRKDDDLPPPGSGPRIRISYIVTKGINWSPHYDLRLDTISKTGILTYRAHFRNETNETWRDATITLSTSQTGFSGVGDKVPWMDPWRISLRKKASNETQPDGGLFSPKEKPFVKKKKAAPRMMQMQVRSLFGDDATAKKRQQSQNFAETRPSLFSALPAAQPNMQQGVLPPERNTFTAPVSVFGSSSVSTPTVERDRHRDRERPSGFPAFGNVSSFRLEESDSDAAESDLEPEIASIGAEPRMRYTASSAEIYGLTTTYELPGQRTIPSSDLTRRHVITEISFPSIDFSHVTVPKLRPAAFLRARFKNNSKKELLTGTVGLTLDGTFLGNSELPRCSPEGSIQVGLGVDEAIQVSYAKPVSVFASQGMLVKEQIVSYSRSTHIYNRRNSRVKILVLDQIPVSEDERLKIGVLEPKGLKAEGDRAFIDANGRCIGAIAGESVSRSIRNSIAGVPPPGPRWNPACGGTVTYKKGGEIAWEIELEGGAEIKLPLDYEARVPGGEAILVS